MRESQARKEINIGLVHLANATGLAATAQEVYRPFVDELVDSSDAERKTAGLYMAKALGLLR